MTLGDKQRLFVRCLVKLLAFGHSKGYEFTLGEAHVINPRKMRWVPDGVNKRTTTPMEDGVHMPGSLHYKRLAIDLNLFVKGRYIRSGSHPAYVELGTFWSGLHELTSWGGDFGDANHFSMKHGGRR